jgi:hypothetical protein
MLAPEQRARGLDQSGNVPALELHRTVIRVVDSADDIQKGRLPRTATPDDGDCRAFLDTRVGVIENAMDTTAFVKTPTQLLKDEHGGLIYVNPGHLRTSRYTRLYSRGVARALQQTLKTPAPYRRRFATNVPLT